MPVFCFHHASVCVCVLMYCSRVCPPLLFASQGILMGKDESYVKTQHWARSQTQFSVPQICVCVCVLGLDSSVSIEGNSFKAKGGEGAREIVTL